MDIDLIIYTILFIKFLYLYKFIEKFSSKFINHKYIIPLTTKIYSCYHSILIVFFSSLYLYDIISLNLWIYLSYITKIYVIFDIFIVILNIKYFKEWKEILFHHFILFNSMLIIEKYPYEFSHGLLAEISNIPLHYCWFLLKTNRMNTIKFKFSSLLLLILFTIFRIINFSHICIIKLFDFHNVTLFEYSLILTLTIMNYRWWILLLKKFYSVIIKNND